MKKKENVWANVHEISKTFVRQMNECMFVLFFFLDFVIWKIPKDIPLFAYINKAANSFSAPCHNRETKVEKRSNRKGIELNGIDQEQAPNHIHTHIKKKKWKRETLSILLILLTARYGLLIEYNQFFIQIYVCIFPCMFWVQMKWSSGWWARARTHSRSLYYLSE